MKFSVRAEHFVRISVVLSFLALTVSCKQDENPTPSQTTAQFIESTLAFLENEGERTIVLSFDKPAEFDGDITLKINTVAPQSFVTVPLATNGQLVLPVAKGQTVVNFKIIASDNLSLDGCKVVKFSIYSVSEGIKPGLLRDITVSMNDDEAPVDATFASDELRVRENDRTTACIDITLAHAAPAEGILIIRLQSSSKYGTDYTTEPAAVGDKIFLHVAEGATSAVIKLSPVNDATFRADRNINFKIIDATGGLGIGRNSSSLFTITEDDGYQLSNISYIRSKYQGEQVIFHGDTYIEGTVTSIDNVAPGRVVVEDGTGALQLQLPTPHTLTRGDVVLFNLNYGVLRHQFGSLEVTQVSFYEKLGTDVVQSDKMTLEDLFERGEDLQSKTVLLTGLVFSEANGTQTMLGDRIATDGIRTIVVRTNASASFAGEPVPGGVVNVTGIFIEIAGAYILYPQDYSDIKKQQFLPVR